MNTKSASLVFGIIFIAVGLLGFVPNPIIADSHNAIFHADAVHSGVHIVSGILFVIFALALPSRAAIFMKVFGIVYFLLGALGVFSIGSTGMTKGSENIHKP